MDNKMLVDALQEVLKESALADFFPTEALLASHHNFLVHVLLKLSGETREEFFSEEDLLDVAFMVPVVGRGQMTLNDFLQWQLCEGSALFILESGDLSLPRPVETGLFYKRQEKHSSTCRSS